MFLFVCCFTENPISFGDDMTAIIKKAKAVMLLSSVDSAEYKQAQLILKSFKDDAKEKGEKKRARVEECKLCT